jgi:hypothetical protein
MENKVLEVKRESEVVATLAILLRFEARTESLVLQNVACDGKTRSAKCLRIFCLVGKLGFYLESIG